jgi:hypothetical protein
MSSRTGAGADAFDFLERKSPVRSFLLVADTEPPLAVLQDAVAAAEHAGDVRADLQVIFAGGFASQHGVVGQRLGHLQDVQIEPPRDFFDQRIAEVAKLILGKQQHRHQRRALARVASQQFGESGFQLCRQFHGLAVHLAQHDVDGADAGHHVGQQASFHEPGQRLQIDK